MDTAFISALSALAGSIVGGMTSGFTTWLGHRSQAKAGRRLHNVSQREALYRDFVVAASEAYGEALTHSEPQLQQIVALYGMMSRMRILSSPEVVECADRTIDAIIDTFFSPNRTFVELRALVKNGERFDPLKEFSQITRDELRGI
jgi:hypothetical protein